jgi:hypothetical protein
MADKRRFVIVGGGLAGAKGAEALREQGFDGEIELYAAEPHLPYERPPLSKAYLKTGENLAEAFVHERSWYTEHGVQLHLGTRVSRVDAAAPEGHPITVTLTTLPARSNRGHYPVTLTVQGGESPEGVPALADLLRQLDLRTINSTAAAQWSDMALYMAVQLLQAQGADLSFYTTTAGTLAYEVRFVSPAAH